MENELQKRKPLRLEQYDYNHAGAYFITICTQNKHCLLSRIVGTGANSVVSQFVSTFKRFCNKEYGKNLWQSRFYDHIIRNQKDYEEHANYIHKNPLRWYQDELYTEE